MSNYSKSTDFASKDTLSSGDPNKIVKGTEIDAEFEAIETAVNSKINVTDIGTTVQAYDADLTTLGAGGAGARSFLGLAAIASSGSASDLSTGTVGTARLGSGTASSTTYLRGDQTWSTVDTTVPIDIQTFNSGGGTTWTKPTGGQTMVKIQVWGGGGGGGRGSAPNAGAGGGGAYNEWVGPISYMGSTATVTVGAAGAGRTGSTGSGTAGGSSSVAIASYPTGSQTVIAYGGGGGGGVTAYSGGGGGGVLGTGGTYPTSQQGGKGYIAPKTNNYGNNADPTGGGSGVTGSGCGFINAYGSVYGGGGGGSGNNASGEGGANSMYGGGGGACGTTAGAGTSLFGGNGGANAAGTTPAGGGGCSPTSNVNGFDGGAGRVVITSW